MSAYDRYDHQPRARGAAMMPLTQPRSVGRRRGTAARHLSLIRAQHDVTDEPADAALLIREDRREIRDAVARLPDRQREVLVLRYWARRRR